ncbi:MerR family transcriptional regulator [[Brevibacterium] frigoritolerans]|uniref:MerR family transcriptional regulator n=1 Tax=Peribacillus frigoritolerans TaxID=450367 RepID=A0A941J852_9BACI|nr:MerR family transcriptional regulator [Peribacillus frigoritolerans]
MELLRKKDIIDQVGVAKSTLSDWISEYSMYIPIVQQGNRTYYKPETIDVLTAVKELRERDFSKTQIAEELASRFTINADETVDLIKRTADNPEKTDGLIAVMSTMSKALDHLGRQDERLREQDSKVAELERKQADYDEIMEKLRSEVAASREKSAELEAKIRAMEEEKPKGFWTKLFGK